MFGNIFEIVQPDDGILQVEGVNNILLLIHSPLSTSPAVDALFPMFYGINF